MKTLNQSSFYIFVLLLLGMGLLLAGCQSISSSTQPSLEDIEAASAGSTDDFIVVDCMLPGQVRKLGKMVYQTPRRPIKATALECQIRGGEYVAYDRSNINTALNVWMEKAEQGDEVAQNYVGEIYQKGFDKNPQYEQAAQWFKKAASKGYSRAEFNLGYLYEQGLGVSKDQVKALNLYRQASGLDTAVVMESELIKERQQSEALREELKRSQEDAQKLRRQLNQSLQQSKQTQQEYERLQQHIAIQKKELEQTRVKLTQLMQYGETEEINDLQDALYLRQADLKKAQAQAAKLKEKNNHLNQKVNQYHQRLSQYDVQTEKLNQLQKELNKRNEETADLREQLAKAQGEMVMVQQAYTREQLVMDKEKENVDRAKAEVETLKKETQQENQQRIQELLAEISQRTAKLGKQRREAFKLKANVDQLKKQAAKYSAQIDRYKAQGKDLEGPKIEIIDPKLLATRSKTIIPYVPAASQREITGKVIAPAGLFYMRVNQKKYQPEKNGLFSLKIPLQKGHETRVDIVAVDTQGKTDTVNFSIPAEEHKPVEVSEQRDPPKVNFGKYYALLIGNNEYRNLPKLETAANDAREFGRILASKYGFTTKVLLNATRVEIYTALDTYRKKLTENDNFLLYYAGHGELDKKNRRGYWLPVDADLDSNINSVPNYTITDIFNIMSVKQAIIISDTCYSGIMTRSAVNDQQVGMSDEKRLKWLREISQKRSRTVLTSGGLVPVIDAGFSDHSIFARSILDALKENNGIIEAGRLYRQIRTEVMDISNQFGMKQIPQYAANLRAGHESGDFLFVPANYQKS
jgi:TPR repeat protein